MTILKLMTRCYRLNPWMIRILSTKPLAAQKMFSNSRLILGPDNMAQLSWTVFGFGGLRNGSISKAILRLLLLSLWMMPFVWLSSVGTCAPSSIQAFALFVSSELLLPLNAKWKTYGGFKELHELSMTSPPQLIAHYSQYFAESFWIFEFLNPSTSNWFVGICLQWILIWVF